MNAIQQKIADNYMEKMAANAYKQAMKAWDKNRRAAEKEIYKRLRDPVFAESLGLPRKLPAHTRNILKHTMALDKLSSSMPERPKIYKRYGIT